MSARIVTDLFGEVPSRAPSVTPVTRYQKYAALRRLQRFDLDGDVGRFSCLMWYLYGYAPSRAPLRVPLAGRQIRWLLESPDAALSARPIPRVVDWFLRRSDRPDPGDDRAAFVEMAYWWSTQQAVAMNVEHALVPQAFVALLSANAIGSWDADTPHSECLVRYAAEHADEPWSLDTEAGRLSAYIRMLLGPKGVHMGLFVSEPVLRRLEAVGAEAAAFARSEPLQARLQARLAQVRAYRAAHARFRSGEVDVSAASLGQDWMAMFGAPPKRDAPRAPVAQPKRSVLPGPVRVIGPINSNSGLGQATRLSIDALRTAGVQVETVDFVLDNPAPRTRHHASVAPAATPGAINILHLNGETLPVAAAFMSPAVFEGAYNIGYFFWEMTQPALVHACAQEIVDEVWVSSAYNQQTYAASTPHPVSHVGMAVAQVDAAVLAPRAQVRAAYGLDDEAFTFVTTFDAYSFMSRKNPGAVLRAFAAAFPGGDEPVRLVVKTHNLMNNLAEPAAEALRREVLALCAADPRIVLVNETLTHDALLSLKAACDVYVSLHRSEGWGFGMLEGMQLGLPSIATAFSGNMDFCTPQTAWLVPWTQVFLGPDDYAFFRPGDWWADPDVSAAAAAMRDAAADPEATRAKGAAARAFVAAHFSPAAIGARYLERLRAIAASPQFAEAVR